MVDRLEELLAQMADEDDEEQEDALALEAKRAAPAAPAPGDEGRPEGQSDLENSEEPERLEKGTKLVPMEDEEPWAAAPGNDREYQPGDNVPAGARENESAKLRVLRAGDGRAAEGLGPAKPAAAERVAESAPAPGAATERGLEGLYRRTAQASRPTAQGLPVEQAGRTRSAEEPGRTAALTVDELDRAVRRDSRRYDGGMSIF